MRIARWIPKTTHTHNMQYYLPSHCNNGCTNVPQCYVICTLIVLCLLRICVCPFVITAS